MVFSKEVSKRSPLRVFERSIHGGLGRGNIGVVSSRRGVGKSAFLIGVALDDAMRARKVLHISVQHPVERIVNFYDRLFSELVKSCNMEDVDEARLTLERNRHILSYSDHEFEIARVRDSLDFLATHAEFKPEAVVIDGWPDFESVTEEEISALKQLAVDAQVELWITALRHREGQERDERDVPMELARFDELFSVIVRLEPRGDHVKLRLVKDHENTELADLHLELDTRTLLLRWH